MRGVKKTCEGGREGGAQSSFLEMSSAADLALSWREGRRRMGAELRVKGMVADGSTSVSSTRRQQSAQPLHRDYFALCFPAAQELGQCVLFHSISCFFVSVFRLIQSVTETFKDSWSTGHWRQRLGGLIRSLSRSSLPATAERGQPAAAAGTHWTKEKVLRRT